MRRVGIPKPDGSERELGIPTVVDRLIQQALLQVLQPLIDAIEEFLQIDIDHDVLMSRLRKRIADAGVIRLIRAYLNAGIMRGGVASQREEVTPQGGPLSPLLANVLLDEVDRELERRGHHFVRYADDCNVYVRSQEGRATGDGTAQAPVRQAAFEDQ